MKNDRNNNISSDDPGILIPGIDTAADIRHCGNSKIYMEFLSDVYGIIDQKSAETEKFLSDGNLKAFTTTVHALKTTCRMLGDTALSESFFELEQIGKENAFEKAVELTPGVLARFRALKPLLEPYAEAAPEKTVPFSAEEIITLLSGLEDSTAEFDIAAAEETMKKLLTYECDKELSDRLTRLSVLVNDLDYDEAAEMASDMKNTLTET